MGKEYRIPDSPVVQKISRAVGWVLGFIFLAALAAVVVGAAIYLFRMAWSLAFG